MKLFRSGDGYLIAHKSSCNRKVLIHVNEFSGVDISGWPRTWRFIGVDIEGMNVMVSWVLV